MLKAGKQKLLLNLRDDAVVSGALGVLVKELMQRRRGGSDGQAKPQEQHETGRKPANHSSPPGTSPKVHVDFMRELWRIAQVLVSVHREGPNAVASAPG